jgi:hypothetical protein
MWTKCWPLRARSRCGLADAIYTDDGIELGTRSSPGSSPEVVIVSKNGRILAVQPRAWIEVRMPQGAR